MFSVTKYIKVWFIFSGALIAGAIILFLVWGLRLGIDFRGGSLSELEFLQDLNPQEVRQNLIAQGFKDVIVQPVSNKIILIKTEPLEGPKLNDFKKILNEKFGESNELRFESIGPTISRELVRKAYLQIILVCLGILIYIAYAFRKVSRESKKSALSSWKLGLAAIIALIHDLIITVGFFTILGKYHGVEVDTLFITALLTISGFSVHDTIVVFDRIRENLRKYPYQSLKVIIDFSINQTLARSINASTTLIFVLVAMLLFGGQTTFNFVLALLIGVTIGTYSSIFIASPILYLCQKER